MKLKIVFFFFGTKHIGGVQTLFIRLAKFLQNKCDVFISDVSQSGVFYDATKGNNITFLKFSFGGVTLPNNAVVVTPVEFCVFAGCLRGENLRFLFWDVYPGNMTSVSFFRFLSFFKRTLRLGLSVRTEKFLMQLIDLPLYLRLRSLCKTMSEKQGLVYMTKDENNAYNEGLWGMKIREKVVPVCVELGDFVELNRNTDYIRVCWLGRFCDFKYPAIKDIIEELHKFCQKYPKRNVHLDLVGYGSWENKIRRDCARCALDNFVTEIKGEIRGKALEVYLKNSVDLVCTHGTSVLEGARFGIPSVICCGGCESKEDVKYQWLYKSEESCVGNLRGFKGEETLEKFLNELCQSPDIIGRKCYEHVAKYYDVTVVAQKFLSAVRETELTLEDIKKTKITKHTFLFRALDFLRFKD